MKDHKTSSEIANEIEIYLDGADEAAMLSYVKDPLIKGFTTNPSLMRKSGVTDYIGFCKKMLTAIPNHPISFEVFADDLSEMKRQAHIIADWGKNVFVKIPVINTKGVPTTPLIQELSQKGIQLNVTALFTTEQVREVCQALKKGVPSIVSVFAGRIADSGRNPMPLMMASSELCKPVGAKLLWASTREVYNIVQAAESGCQIITAPADIVKKLKGFGRSPLDLCADTVQMFKSDSDASKFSL